MTDELEPPAETAPVTETGPAEAGAPSFWAPLRDTRTWALLALRGYLALVFIQAAVGHLGQSPEALAALWSPQGIFAPVGKAATANPTLFVDTIVVLELALGASMIVGFLTRLAGLGGLVLNAFFFAAFEWTDRSQLYLSWDASLAALWLLVLLLAPGRVVGLAALVRRKWPRFASFYT